LPRQDRFLASGQDAGIRISPKILNLIFQQFYRVKTKKPLYPARVWVWPSSKVSWNLTGANQGETQPEMAAYFRLPANTFDLIVVP
jgi:hypothetical protein